MQHPFEIYLWGGGRWLHPHGRLLHNFALETLFLNRWIERLYLIFPNPTTVYISRMHLHYNYLNFTCNKRFRIRNHNYSIFIHEHHTSIGLHTVKLWQLNKHSTQFIQTQNYYQSLRERLLPIGFTVVENLKRFDTTMCYGLIILKKITIFCRRTTTILLSFID